MYLEEKLSIPQRVVQQLLLINVCKYAWVNASMHLEDKYSVRRNQLNWKMKELVISTITCLHLPASLSSFTCDYSSKEIPFFNSVHIKSHLFVMEMKTPPQQTPRLRPKMKVFRRSSWEAEFWKWGDYIKGLLPACCLFLNVKKATWKTSGAHQRLWLHVRTSTFECVYVCVWVSMHKRVIVREWAGVCVCVCISLNLYVCFCCSVVVNVH